MYPHDTLEKIFREHACQITLIVETLIDFEVPFDDVDLLSRMPWQFPANPIAVERERWGLSPVRPLLAFKVFPPPPAWLTPAMMVKMFDLALNGPGEEFTVEDEDDPPDDRALVLPA